jgi:hypothetical protein
MQIELGKIYKTFNGDIVKAVQKVADRFIFNKPDNDNYVCTCFSDGTNFYGYKDFSIVEEINEMNVEVGKVYRTGKDILIKVVSEDDGLFQCNLLDNINQKHCKCYKDGKNKYGYKEYSLVEEVKEEKKTNYDIVYRSNVTGLVYDTIEELENGERKHQLLTDLKVAIDVTFEGDSDIDVSKFIEYIGNSSRRDEIIDYITKETMRSF